MDNARLDEAAHRVWQVLSAECGASLVEKEKSLVHQQVSLLFDAVSKAKELTSYLSFDLPVNLPTGSEYLSNFATTLVSVIAVPGAWLAPGKAFTRLVVLPHECQHVRQAHQKYGSAGPLGAVANFSILYVSSGEERASIEADAYAVSETVQRWLTGKPGDLNRTLESLRRNYAIDEDAGKLAAEILGSHWDTIDALGCAPVWAAKRTIEILEAEFSDLKGTVAV